MAMDCYTAMLARRRLWRSGCGFDRLRAGDVGPVVDPVPRRTPVMAAEPHAPSPEHQRWLAIQQIARTRYVPRPRPRPRPADPVVGADVLLRVVFEIAARAARARAAREAQRARERARQAHDRAELDAIARAAACRALPPDDPYWVALRRKYGQDGRRGAPGTITYEEYAGGYRLPREA
jgi:hypothetical protein